MSMVRTAHSRTPSRALFVGASATLMLLGSALVAAHDLTHPKYHYQMRRGSDREEGIKPLDQSAAYIPSPRHCRSCSRTADRIRLRSTAPARGS